MFGKFREKILSWGIKGLFVLLILSFGMWGIGDYISPGSRGTDIAASVGAIDISSRELSDAVRREINLLRRALGNQIDSEQLQSLGVTDNVLGQLIARGLFTLGAKDLGLVASDDIVRDYIRSDSQFAGRDGRFDRNLFVRVINSNGLSEAGYVSFARADVLRSHYLSGIDSGLKAPRTLVNDVYLFRNEKRVAEVLRIDHAKMTGVGTAAEVELVKFHKDNAARFTAPEYRGVSVIELKAEEIAAEIDVAEERITEAYEDRIEEFTTPERRRIQQFVVADEQAAEAALKRIKEGADFLALAKELAGMEADDADLGLILAGDIPLPDIADEAFSVQKAGVTEPIKTPLGWHIINVAEIKKAAEKPFSEVREALKKDIALDMSLDAIFDLSNKLEDELGGGASFEEAARRLGLKVRRIRALDARGATPEGVPVTGLEGPRRVIIQTAFTTQKGEQSALTELGEAGFFILRVDKVVAPALRPLDKIRGQVAAAWKRVKQAELAEAKADELFKRVDAGLPLATAAKDLKLTVVTTAPFQRTGRGLTEAVPASLIADLFTLQVGKATMISGRGAEYIARLKEVVTANPFADKKGVDALGAQLGRTLGGDLVAQLSAALRERHGVTVNRSAVEGSVGGLAGTGGGHRGRTN